MDEAAAASTSEAEVIEDPFSGGSASENSSHESSKATMQSAGDFCCHDCGEAFWEEAAYLQHCKLHTEENLELNSRNHLDNLHDTTKDSDTTNVCNLCSLSFTELSELLSHIEKLHGQTLQNESSIQMNSGPKKQHTYECPDCGKIYATIGHLLNHQRSHMQPSKSLFFHNVEHLEKKAFQCETCGRNYSRASALDAHRRCHEEKLVKSRNRSSDDSSQNKTRNTREKIFTCPCGKAFAASVGLKTHQRFSRNSICTQDEMKEKPRREVTDFYCRECDKYFNGHLGFINHQRWHANHSEDPKRFHCKECGKEFMTLTFYYRHQRMVHATPAKSFLQQVGELQKKAFECQTCGLKFTRPSALQSHQLQHSDAFSETEKITVLPQGKIVGGYEEETRALEEPVEAESLVLPRMSEESFENDSDEDMDSYEPGDFNVQVISASESEDESTQDTNPDLELVCESDQEGREDGETVCATSCLVSKTDMDLKIVQIDLEPAEEQTTLVARNTGSHTEKRFNCPQCYRWFTSKASLRTHKMWHGIRMKKQHHSARDCKECSRGQNFKDYKTVGQQDDMGKAQLEFKRNSTGDTNGDAVSCGVDKCSQTPPSGAVRSGNFPNISKLKFQDDYACLVCGKPYKSWLPFKNHLQLHENGRSRLQAVHEFQCPYCDMWFVGQMRLYSHLRSHRWSKPVGHVELSKNQPHWCLSCAEGFASEEALETHLQSHLLPTYTCGICQKCFTTSVQLYEHSRTHGVFVSDPPDETQVQTGQTCSAETFDENGMPRKPKYFKLECFDCDMGFDDVQELHTHYVKHATGELPMTRLPMK